MMLSELIADLPVTPWVGAEQLDRVEVTGITHDSRRVEAGDLFVAWKGELFDGTRFATDAIGRGATAVLAGDPPTFGTANAKGSVPWLITALPHKAMGSLAARLYGRPDRELITVGVTGTNGKSTIAILVAALLNRVGLPAGVLGTIGYWFADHHYGSGRTTPESTDLFRLLRRMRNDGALAAALEVSSHSLALDRVEEARFDVAVFTNLTRDHLDFHGDFESYFAAKRRLFDLLKPAGTAVVCIDDEYGRRLAADLKTPLLTYGEGGDVSALEVALRAAGTRATLRTPRGPFEYDTPLVGRYNLWNTMATVAVGEALSLDPAAMRLALAESAPVRGRLEPVNCGQPFPVFVDYAHTPDALDAALRAVREVTGGRIAVVFGCGGNKDQGKRPMMGEIAGRLADLAVLTDDNPRNEDPALIHRDALVGLERSGGRYEVVPGREAAIRYALEQAAGEPGWTVVVAGKGHEDTQTIGRTELRFVDHEILAKHLGELSGRTANG